MIYIEEIRPKKLSGLTSFFVKFPYNEKLIGEIKLLAPAVYHKKDYAWEIAANYLSKLLDTCVKYDDVSLTMLTRLSQTSRIAIKSESSIVGSPGGNSCDTERLNKPEKRDTDLTEAEIRAFKIKPFKHQIEAINFGLSKDHKKWLLLDGCGLGKSAEMVWTAETLHQRGLVDHCLFICGVNSLKQNIAGEIKKFGNENYVILGEKKAKSGKISYGTVADRVKQLREPIDAFWVITNVETIRDDKFVEAFKKSKNKFDMICYDEIHRGVANKSSQSASSLLKLDAEYKVGATGTLVVNSPVGAFVPLSWTDNDHATLTNYKAQYCDFGGFNNSQIVGYRNLDFLQAEISEVSLRRTKDDLAGLPPRNITVETLELTDEHQKFYEAIKDGVREEADKIELNASNLLALTTRLRQATADPTILTTQQIMSTKIIRCKEIVEDLMAQNEKVVIMSTYKAPIYHLAELLKEYQPLISTGDQSDAEVSANVGRFQNDPSARIFIGSTAKCATGLTLNAAAYMICLDVAWTAAMNNQCFDRIHRANNTRPAFITVLNCKDTIDEHVWEISQFKQELSDYMIDDSQNTRFTAELKSIINNL